MPDRLAALAEAELHAFVQRQWRHQLDFHRDIVAGHGDGVLLGQSDAAGDVRRSEEELHTR